MASVVLTWPANPATDNVIAYDVYGANGTSVAFGSCPLLVSVTSPTWTDTGLPNSQARTYYLKARNALGASVVPSGPLNISTPAPSGVYVQNAGGAPSIQEGTHASRPAAGTAGRVYIETDTKTQWRDNGASWDQIGGGVIGPGSATDSDFVQFNGTTGSLVKDGGLSLDTDGTLATNSDSKIASEKAVKTYVDAKFAAVPISIGFVLNTGATGTNVGPEMAAIRAGSFTKVIAVTKSSDPSTALTFNIKKNGTTIFSSSPSIAAGTSAGTVTDKSSSLATTPLSVAANDVFTIDISGGNANWAATIELG